ncbi:DUF3530 family protein [Neptuniibacter sp. QD72_48]|uniref:DUF3530 family protein n=1 Tax=unclassified Neptuniibacter TaxID=2630693 RepID=UPI0039F6443C
MKFYSFLLTLSLISSTAFSAEEEANAGTEKTASATQPSTPTVERTEPSRENNLRQALSSHPDPSTQVLQLDTGKDGEQLLGYYLTEGSGIPQGGVIIFPDELTHMDWPENLNQIRTGLANHGWYTLAVFLPQPAQTPLPKRTLPVLSAIKPTQSPDTPQDSSTEPVEAQEEATTENTETPSDAVMNQQENAANAPTEAVQEQEEKENYQEIVARLGNTAFEHLKKEKGVDRVVILGAGTGATWAAQYVQKHQEQQNLRLVLLDARDSITENAPRLLEILPEIKTTIIDLHHSARRSTNTNHRENSPERRLRLARHKRMNNFHQSRLPQANDNWKKDNSWLFKHVRGMINTYIIKAEQQSRSIDIPSEEQSNKEQAPG